MLNIIQTAMLALTLFAISVNANSSDVLAYLEHSDGYWQVYLKNGKKPAKQISTSSYDKSKVSWFADGKELFICGIQGDIEIINIKTGGIKSIQLPHPNINDALISPDGKKIIYSAINRGSINNKLWLYDVKTEDFKPLLKTLVGRQYDPKWHPDSNQYYFVTGVLNKSYGIAKSRINSNVSEPVVHNQKLNLDVDIALNGDIAYSSNITSNFEIWMISSGKPKQLTKSAASAIHPSWSTDGGSIYFEKVVAGVTNIWKASVKKQLKTQGNARQITFSKNGARYPVVYRQGALK